MVGAHVLCRWRHQSRCPPLELRLRLPAAGFPDYGCGLDVGHAPNYVEAGGAVADAMASRIAHEVFETVRTQSAAKRCAGHS